ncbi:MAG: hypothetical protein ABSC64_13695 [Candidatus Korobacteraceae bacterium]
MFALQVLGTSPSRELTLDEAKQLAPNARDYPQMKFGLFNETDSPDFYTFEITAAVPDDASPVLAHFSVNRSNGDVWEAVGCFKVKSPDLRKLQQTLRRKINLSNADAKLLSKKAPCQP